MSEDLVRLLEQVVAVVFLAGIGGAIGWWIEKQIRNRRLRKLGFEGNDLKSKKAFFARWGEIAAAKIPEKISLNSLHSHSWAVPQRHVEFSAGFESMGFQRWGTFGYSPGKSVIEFWTNEDQDLFGTIVDSACGIYSEVMAKLADGSTICFENTDECNQKHLERHTWIHCGFTAPNELLTKALQHPRVAEFVKIRPNECVTVYEQAVNANLTWKRDVGISGEEMKHLYERTKKNKRVVQ